MIVAMGASEKWGAGGIIPETGSNYQIAYETAIEAQNAYIGKIGVAPRFYNGIGTAREYRRSIGM